MSRFPSLLLALALALPAAACGGGKKGATTPTGGAGQADGGGGVPGMDDRGGGPDQPDVPDGLGDSGGQDGDGVDIGPDGQDPADPDAPEQPAEAIKPPNLDLSPDERAKKVTAHLSTARKALAAQNRDPETAVKEAKAALDADSTSIDAVAMLALAYFHMGWNETAEQTLRTVYDSADKGVQQRARNNANIFYVFGLLYERAGDDLRAQVAYESAVKADANHRSALINLGRLYLQSDLPAKAIPLYEKVVQQLNVKTALTLNNLGAAYRGRAQDYPNDPSTAIQYLRRAEDAFKQAIQMDRNYGPAYYNLGVLYMDADGMPGADGRPLDTLKRLQTALTYIDEYQKKPGADQNKASDRIKALNRDIKREQRNKERNGG